MYEHDIHIGNLIKAELHTQYKSVAWLATQVGTDRSNMYKILRCADMNTALLRRISAVLEHDFFAEISIRKR